MDINIQKLQSEFKNQVICKKVNHNKVPEYLIAADYGLLIREESITNKVASPVKFAEYLACGLKVIISENLGDYSEFIEKYNCGVLFKNYLKETKVNKINQRELANNYFIKSKYKELYKKILTEPIQ
jgi:hypothetical protein